MQDVVDIKIALLAGGAGTRLSGETDIRPKPMVEIVGKPILWHFMPSSAQPIVAPMELATIQPAAVIVMNSIYREEIAAVLDQMELSPTILSL